MLWTTYAKDWPAGFGLLISVWPSRMTFTFTTDGKENNVARGHKKFKFQQFCFFFKTQSLWFSYVFSMVDFMLQ